MKCYEMQKSCSIFFYCGFLSMHNQLLLSMYCWQIVSSFTSYLYRSFSIAYSQTKHDGSDPKAVLSVGLSVFILMLSGLVTQVFFPTIREPLALQNYLPSLSGIIVILTLLAYYRNKDNFDIMQFYNVQLMRNPLKMKYVLLPIMFPILAALGTYLMNNYSLNYLLIIFLTLIPAYFAMLLIGKDQSTGIYLFATWMIGLKLLLMHSLTCDYITGSDIHIEYYLFQIVKSHLQWDLINLNHPLFSCLSVTILPTALQTLTDINDLYIYKLVYPLIFSLVPVCLFTLLKNRLPDKYNFISCLILISQGTFIIELVEHARQEIAFLFVVLAILVFLNKGIGSLVKRRLLFIIFSFGIILSHYTTAYIFLVTITFTWLIVCSMDLIDRIKPLGVLGKKDEAKFITAPLVILVGSLAFLWFCLITQIQFRTATLFLGDAIESLNSLYIAEKGIVGGGIENSIPAAVRFWIRNVTFLLIGVGFIKLSFWDKQRQFNREYLAMMAICGGIVALMLINPSLSKGYGITRAYIQSLLVLAPCFAIGGEAIIRTLFLQKKSIVCSWVKKYSIYLLVGVLILQNISASTLTYNLFNEPYLMDLNANGTNRESLYIVNQEIIGAEWLVKNKNGETIFCDVPGYQRLYLGYVLTDELNTIEPPIDNSYFWEMSQKMEGYIYLRHTNVYFERVHPFTIYSTQSQVHEMNDYWSLLHMEDKVYGNGGSEIWY